MRNGIVAALMVVVVSLGAMAGYFIGANAVTTVNGAGMKSLETFSACTILDPSKGISIQITDGTRPVGDASISVQIVSACYTGTVPRVVAQYNVATNSTGWPPHAANLTGHATLASITLGKTTRYQSPLPPEFSRMSTTICRQAM